MRWAASPSVASLLVARPVLARWLILPRFSPAEAARVGLGCVAVRWLVVGVRRRLACAEGIRLFVAAFDVRCCTVRHSRVHDNARAAGGVCCFPSTASICATHFPLYRLGLNSA